jgi:hypothetical protein
MVARNLELAQISTRACYYAMEAPILFPVRTVAASPRNQARYWRLRPLEVAGAEARLHSFFGVSSAASQCPHAPWL